MPKKRRGSRRARPRLKTAASWLAAAVIPVAVLLLAAELILGALGRGTSEVGWLLDKSVTSRDPVFIRGKDPKLMVTSHDLTRIDHASHKFPARKPAGAFRVFCLGGSTTAGWPAQHRGGYPAWLGAVLKDVLPKTDVEVVNAGFHGFDSTRVLAVLREILSYEPDAVVIYTGYNEYQAFRLRHDPRIRLHLLLLRRSRIYNELLKSLRVPPGAAASRLAWRIDDEEKDVLLAGYERNITRMIEAARSQGAAPVLVSLPHNPEFREKFSFTREYLPQLNSILGRLSAERGVPLVDLRDVLKPPGDFLDSVHSTPDGYRKLAEAVARTLCGLPGLLPGSCDWNALRAKEPMAAELGLGDPEFLAHLNVKLGLLALAHDMRPQALKYFSEAERAAPNPVMVHAELESIATHELLDVMIEATRALGYADRAARYEAQKRGLPR